MKKTSKIIYWIATLWLSLGIISTAIVQLLKGKSGQGALDSIIHLGYPDYILPLLGVWKILGVVAILMPKLPLVKEWAYAGFFFVMLGAVYSHIASGDAIRAILPSLLLLILIIISWYLRPTERKIVFAN
jgi:hypothetical protein